MVGRLLAGVPADFRRRSKHDHYHRGSRAQRDRARHVDSISRSNNHSLQMELHRVRVVLPTSRRPQMCFLILLSAHLHHSDDPPGHLRHHSPHGCLGRRVDICGHLRMLADSVLLGMGRLSRRAMHGQEQCATGQRRHQHRIGCLDTGHPTMEHSQVEHAIHKEDCNCHHVHNGRLVSSPPFLHLEHWTPSTKVHYPENP